MKTIIRGKQQGFTLLEMIMVVTIILFLLGTLVVFVSNAHLESQKQETRKIIDGLESALVTFYDEYGTYPTLATGTSEAASTSLYMALTGSGTLTAGSLTFTGTGSVASLASLPAGAMGTDPATNNPIFVDAWHNTIGCVIYSSIPGSSTYSSYQANGGMPFIYSSGPDGQSTWSPSTTLPPTIGAGDADNISNFRDMVLSGYTWNFN